MRSFPPVLTPRQGRILGGIHQDFDSVRPSRCNLRDFRDFSWAGLGLEADKDERREDKS